MLHLLIISEDIAFADLFREQNSGGNYKTTFCTTAIEALKISKEGEFDIMLIDLNMSDIDGIELCLQFRNQPSTNKTGLILISDRMEDYVCIAAFNAGADDCLCKPLNMEILAHKMKAIHQRYSLIKNNFIQEEEEKTILIFEINDNQKQLLTLNGQQIELANKEAQIIRLLISKPEKVFSRDEIYGSIWGVNKHVGDRTIDVHIRNIRSKLGDNFVKTVNGVGYKYIQDIA